ncbi:MAG: hypothetical protein Q7R85_02865 [bacterium]|nr:hypothetical protein [bacterium]
MVELRFTAGRFRRWLVSFAKRAGLSVTEARWKIDAFAETTLCNDDRIVLRHLERAELDDSAHQQIVNRCWRCHAFAVIARLFFAGMHERIAAVGRRRERALYGALCRLENMLAGKPEEDGVRESEPKRKGSPYANVGRYDPEADEEDEGGCEESALTRRVTLEELLRFPSLPIVRRFAVNECGEDRAVVYALKNVRIVFGPAHAHRGEKREKRGVRRAARLRRKR